MKFIFSERRSDNKMSVFFVRLILGLYVCVRGGFLELEMGMFRPFVDQAAVVIAYDVIKGRTYGGYADMVNLFFRK